MRVGKMETACSVLETAGSECPNGLARAPLRHQPLFSFSAHLRTMSRAMRARGGDTCAPH